MNEAMRLEIVQRHQAGMSVRAIATELGISRGAVTRALARVQAQREGRATPSPRPRPRQSIIDPFEPLLKELLAKYPNLTTERALQELQARGFTGKYTVVRQRLGLLRPRAARPPVPRFETGPGLQAQMDYGVYDIDFTREGRRRVYLFSYLLGYSRRQYLRFVESMDLPTTLREHVHAFHHLGGVARVCLYDNFKAVVLRHDADGALYNPKFLAFATHYGFRPQACRVRRPQTKGKVERKFFYVETSLLNGRTFDTLEHLNEVTAWWLANVADVRVLRDFKETPLQRHQREQPHLLTLPTCDFDTAQVVYRHVNVEGYVTHRLNLYSVPWSYIGQVLPVRITESEVIIYSIGSGGNRPPSARAQHRRPACGRPSRAIIPPTIPASVSCCCGNASANWVRSPCSSSTACSPSRSRANSKPSNCWRWSPTTSVTTCVPLSSVPSASAPSPWRRCDASSPLTAKPKPLLDELADLHRDTLDPLLRDDPIGPRPTSDYQHLLLPEETADETPSAENPKDEPDQTDRDREPA